MGSVIKVKANTLVVLNVPPSIDYTAPDSPYSLDEEFEANSPTAAADDDDLSFDEAEEEKIDILNNYTTQARRSLIKSQSVHHNLTTNNNSNSQPTIPRYSSFNMRHHRTSSTSQYHLPRHTRIYNQPLPSRKFVYPPSNETIFQSNLRV
ncbi:hypothetical protein TRICI_001314 [Trichomonascus ciferrii]|uniref:Uncharacterized protein n=1 Tax=Trichomonascus ciferrii TaxID=44093 RepID=A0A642V9F9_9ASCO|nr:hypothetical protein TRICI_001314 [Trichomonascus ciferrii]